MQQPLLAQSPVYPAKIVAGFLVVALAMIEMFSVPRSYFVLGSLVATTCMICVAFLLHPNFTSLFKPTPKTIAVGVGTAGLLYLIFIAGNVLVKSISPLGVSASNENSIYSLFASTPLLLRVVVFVLDAFGFESYFRGVLQPILAARIGVGSVFAIALIDAAIHISSLNSLFVITTFIADSVWGLNFYFTKDLSSSIANHLLWDVLIFIIIPIT
jgi:membrane protease YdiL (CAAX protease family)